MLKQEQYKRVYEVLEGLSVGDALGEICSYSSYSVRQREEKGFAQGPWWWTDDTAMALGIIECLEKIGRIDQDVLAWIFSQNFNRNSDRGYGRMARHILKQIHNGTHWLEASKSAFGGGSMGNGAAMRIAPLGIWFAHDLSLLIEQAKLSSQVTHYHHEGIAGAIAIALATAMAYNTTNSSSSEARAEIISHLLEYTPKGATYEMMKSAFAYDPKASPEAAGRDLGNGSLVTSVDTVPFVLWSSLRSLDDYKEAFLSTVEAGGDCDTNAAMVGAIITARLGKSCIPKEWIKKREALPEIQK